MPNKFSLALREIITIAIRNHPRHCTFKPNAVDGAMKWLEENGPFRFEGKISESLLDQLVAAVQSQEIYCPHEGIDKRSEYYGGIALAGWSEWAQFAHETI